MWKAILELGAFLLEEFGDLKFWKKKRRRRKLEKEQGLPRKTMIYPSIYHTIILFIVLLICGFLFVFMKTWYFDDAKQAKMLTEVERLLESEKMYQGQYPSQLENLIRNNPLRSNIALDVWGNEYYYKVVSDESYILKSKGKDGILNTEDDIISSK